MTRSHTETIRLGKEKTGLKAAIFVHVDYTPAGEITGVRLSHKSKEKDNVLDSLLTAIGDAVTDIVTTPIQKAG